MATSEPWYVSERAESLAFVLLTGFPVQVKREAERDKGLDLRVVVDPKKQGLREFGVEVKGTTRIDTLFSNDYRVRPQLIRAARKQLRGYIFPVALLLFDVTTDEGFFGWLLQPVVTPDGARLEEPDPISMQMATNARIEKALSEVRDWYEARPLRMNGKAANSR